MARRLAWPDQHSHAPRGDRLTRVKRAGVRAIAAIVAIPGIAGLVLGGLLGASSASGAAAAEALASTAPVASVPTGVEDFTFESFDAEYFLDLDENGYVTTRVVETIVALFDTPYQNRGIIRAIPDEAFGYDLDVQLTSITNAAGSAVYV